MLQILRIILSIATFLLATYSIFSKNNDYLNHMILSLTLLMLVSGLDEFKKDRKGYGWMFTAVFLFGLYVTSQRFFGS